METYEWNVKLCIWEMGEMNEISSHKFNDKWGKYFNLFKSRKIPKGYLANSVDPDQMMQNAASDQGLHYLH